MPLLAAAILGAFLQAIGTLVGRVLISLGIGYVAYSGIDTMVTYAKTTALSNIQGLPATALQLAGVLQVGTCINILTSALLARLVIRGLTSGLVTRMVTKG